jgi:hypothetical protein
MVEENDAPPLAAETRFDHLAGGRRIAHMSVGRNAPGRGADFGGRS